MSVKNSVANRPKIGGAFPVFGVKKEPRKLGWPNVTSPIWSEGATVQMRYYAVSHKFMERIGSIKKKKTLHT